MVGGKKVYDDLKAIVRGRQLGVWEEQLYVYEMVCIAFILDLSNVKKFALIKYAVGMLVT